MKCNNILYISRHIGVLILLVSNIAATQAFAGQVVTDSHHQWAKEAVAQEKSKKTVTAENTLGILYFQNKTHRNELQLLQKGLTFMLITDLSKVEGLQLIERVKLQALLDELGLKNSGLISSKETERICRLLQAEYILGGEVLREKNNLFDIKAHLLNIEKEKTTGKATVSGKLLDQLFKMEKQLLFSIIKMLKIKLTTDQQIVLKKPITGSLEAFISLMKGIEESDRENYDNALIHYQKAVALDPELEPAKEAIAEIISLGLAGGQSKASDLIESIRNRTSQNDQITVENATKRVIPAVNLNSRVIIDW